MSGRQRREPALVYGLVPLHDTLALVNEADAKVLRDEINTVWACKTVGAARALAPRLTATHMPVDLEDELLDEPDDAPIRVADSPAIADGDWPPMADSYALTTLPAKLLDDLAIHAGAARRTTAFNGDYFEIPVDRETDLVRITTQTGHAIRRDDSLIRDLAGGDNLWGETTTPGPVPSIESDPSTAE